MVTGMKCNNLEFNKYSLKDHIPVLFYSFLLIAPVFMWNWIIGLYFYGLYNLTFYALRNEKRPKNHKLIIQA